MRTFLAMLTAVAGFASIAAAATAAPRAVEPSTPAAVQRAFTEWRSGLRHEDGELACSRMTRAARQAVIAAVAEEGVTGLGCAGILETAGRELWTSMKSRRLHDIVVRRARARALTNVGSDVSFRRENGRWKLDRPAT